MSHSLIYILFSTALYFWKVHAITKKTKACIGLGMPYLSPPKQPINCVNKQRTSCEYIDSFIIAFSTFSHCSGAFSESTPKTSSLIEVYGKVRVARTKTAAEHPYSYSADIHL